MKYSYQNNYIMLTFNLECFNEANVSDKKAKEKDFPYKQVAKVCSSKITLRKNTAVTIDSVLELNCHPKEKLIKLLELADFKFETCAGVNTEGFGWSIYLPLFTFLPRDTIALSHENGVDLDNIGFQHNMSIQKLSFGLPIYNISQAILVKFITGIYLYKLEFDTKINDFNSRYGMNLGHGVTFEIGGPADTILNYSILISFFTLSGPISDIADKSIYGRLISNMFSFSNPRITNLSFEHAIGIGNNYVRYQIGTSSFFIKLLENKNKVEQRYFYQSLEFNLKPIYNFIYDQINNTNTNTNNKTNSENNQKNTKNSLNKGKR